MTDIRQQVIDYARLEPEFAPHAEHIWEAFVQGAVEPAGNVHGDMALAMAAVRAAIQNPVGAVNEAIANPTPLRDAHLTPWELFLANVADLYHGV